MEWGVSVAADSILGRLGGMATDSLMAGNVYHRIRGEERGSGWSVAVMSLDRPLDA